MLACAGHVPSPDEHGENQPAEVFAPLRESAWTTGKEPPAERVDGSAVVVIVRVSVSSEYQTGVDPGGTFLPALPAAQASAAFLSSNGHHDHRESLMADT